ncbi:MAG TPA: hypothetical protein VD993_00140 [Chitinophagaceae bacterium]|nr:hypothetical protein [Chitinophagaceae bacterium]
MRRIIIVCIAVVCLTKAFSQKTKVVSDILTYQQVKALFPDTVCKRLGIVFPIFRVYAYADNAGKYYCILSESQNEVTADKDTFSHSIKAVNVRINNGSFIKLWEISDHIVRNDNDETSIWFWTKYIDFDDYDGDSLVEPVIIYGTWGINGYGNGRIKFIIYYKGRKVAIRHQNGDLDFERETLVDKAFYQLPSSLQAAIKQKMMLMEEDDHAIFPGGWQNAMLNKKTSFQE